MLNAFTDSVLLHSVMSVFLCLDFRGFFIDTNCIASVVQAHWTTQMGIPYNSNKLH